MGKPRTRPQAKHQTPSISYLLLASLGLVLSGCPNEGFQDNSASTITPQIQVWDLSDSSQFTFDSDAINSSAGSLSLKPFQSQFPNAPLFTKGVSTAVTASASQLTLSSSESAQRELSSTWTPRFSSLVAYWPFNVEQSSTPTNLPATVGPAFSVSSGTVTGTTGMVDQSINVSGALSAAATISWTSPRATLSLWVNHSSLAGNQRYLDIGNSGFYLQFDSGTGKVILGAKVDRTPGEGYVITTWGDSGFTTNEWEHIVGTYDGEVLRVFVNGHQISTQTVTGSLSQASGYTLSSSNASLAVSGKMDEVAVWSEALSTDDIIRLYHKQKQKFSGTWTSPILKFGASRSWESMTLGTSFPFNKPLVPSASTESASDYSAMTANLSMGLIGSWGFEETTYNSTANEIVDRSGSGNHGKIAYTNGSAAPVPGTKSHGGIIGEGLELHSVADHSGAYFSSLPEITSTFTLAFWSKLPVKESPVGNAALLARASWGASESDWRGYQVRGNNVTGVQVEAYTSGSSGIVCSGGSVYDGQWHHFAIVFSAGSCQLVIDGVSIAQNSYTLGDGFTGTPALVLGKVSGAESALIFDEVALWTKALSLSEIKELYRRAANRVRYQVRSCVDPDCQCMELASNAVASSTDCDGDGILNSNDNSDSYRADWLGPDGSQYTSYSELQNTTSVNFLGMPTSNILATPLSLNWVTSFFTAFAKPKSNPYFQVRAFLEAEDNALCSSAACLPDIQSISVGTAGHLVGKASVAMNTSIAAPLLASIQVTATPENCVALQVSTDEGSTWQYWSASANSGTGGWTNSKGDLALANLSSDLNKERLAQLEGTSYRVRAVLDSGTAFDSNCELKGLEISTFPTR